MNEGHWYLSSACFHGLHMLCRMFCRWCRSECICRCHQ